MRHCGKDATVGGIAIALIVHRNKSGDAVPIPATIFQMCPIFARMLQALHSIS
jgi:hypothetical protein